MSDLVVDKVVLLIFNTYKSSCSIRSLIVGLNV